MICFNLAVSERNMHILYCRHIWAELSPLLDISERNFFPGWGGGVHVYPVHPLCIRACIPPHPSFFS